MVVFVRRGCFVRRADGVETLLDPTSAYCMNPGEEQLYDHPHDHGDDCTSLFFDPTLLATLWGGDPTLPSGPVPISPQIDLDHRLLLAAARRRIDPTGSLSARSHSPLAHSSRPTPIALRPAARPQRGPAAG
jgi:hypothetical protein